MRAVLVAALLVAVGLAGCAGDAPATFDPRDLEPGKGAIDGLLVDDRFRPIHLVDRAVSEFQAEGFILLQETGQETKTNKNGEFLFTDLAPGQYTLRVTATGHEARPIRVQVVEGAFEEAQIEARRTSSEGSFVISQFFSAFVPCSVRFIANGYVLGCIPDQSGDTYRAAYNSDLRHLGDNITYMLTEMLADNVKPMYRVQIRDGGHRYASATEYEVDYIRILNEYNATNEDNNFYGDNRPFLNDRTFDTILFVGSNLEREMNELGQCCGLGLEMGTKAEFLQLVYIGPPQVDIETHCVLCA